MLEYCTRLDVVELECYYLSKRGKPIMKYLQFKPIPKDEEVKIFKGLIEEAKNASSVYLNDTRAREEVLRTYKLNNTKERSSFYFVVLEIDMHVNHAIILPYGTSKKYNTPSPHLTKRISRGDFDELFFRKIGKLKKRKFFPGYKLHLI